MTLSTFASYDIIRRHSVIILRYWLRVISTPLVSLPTTRDESRHTSASQSYLAPECRALLRRYGAMISLCFLQKVGAICYAYAYAARRAAIICLF